MDARFEDVAPVAFAYDTSPRKNEISRLIRKSYFGDRHIDNDTMTSAVNVSLKTFISSCLCSVSFVRAKKLKTTC